MLLLTWGETALGWYLSDICLRGWVAPGVGIIVTAIRSCDINKLFRYHICRYLLQAQPRAEIEQIQLEGSASSDQNPTVFGVSVSVHCQHSLLYSLWPVAVSNDQSFVSFTVSPSQWRWYCQAVWHYNNIYKEKRCQWCPWNCCWLQVLWIITSTAEGCRQRAQSCCPLVVSILAKNSVKQFSNWEI